MIGFFALVIIYFGFSWGLPWHKLPSTISFSYIFDLLFALGVSFFYRLPWKFKWNITRQTWKAVAEVVALAVAAIAAIWYMDIETPFRLVNGLEWHLLFFAPILEELVFRQTFQRVLIAQVGGKYVTSMLVASIFAFSHLVGLTVLPVEYVPFIGFQVFYTFVLGIICGQALLRFHSVIAPIFLHFLFNLSFYIALQLEVI
ncbi:CPBP family intramembrane glutamic endopeptidase [Peredibacter starrii]|uniref:CPBP family intramembrane glutamic endopeptidase n=1 Tax=Peredibacter starrii TaxID=28202 RepID=A0AAX4HMC0_9BACT|nr:CPBP family intramembrane glutamic endopeptidase [Peredibacter starrii]WPU64414.1 CPBP family intramembrane glutamic endopeptidase [Peredibacter starrii]